MKIEIKLKRFYNYCKYNFFKCILILETLLSIIFNNNVTIKL